MVSGMNGVVVLGIIYAIRSTEKVPELLRDGPLHLPQGTRA